MALYKYLYVHYYYYYLYSRFWLSPNLWLKSTGHSSYNNQMTNKLQTK